MFHIAIDEEVYCFLKRQAEPFKDTPNSVLRKLLLLQSNQANIPTPTNKNESDTWTGIPNALAQILEMIILVKKEGLSRIKATHFIAKDRGITFSSVIDKYCRQLGKKAYQIDELLSHSNLEGFKKLLIERFPFHSKVIEDTFSDIDEEVYSYLKQHAQPFIDIPNTVLEKLLFFKNDNYANNNTKRIEIPCYPDSIPSALAQILQMVFIVKKYNMSRVEATGRVAESRRITTQAVLDKYCRQLGKKASEIDKLLVDSNIDEFRKILIEKFPFHSKVIEDTFSDIDPKPTEVKE